MPRPTLRTERLVLVPQTPAAARALLAGEDPGLPLAAGYPHADSLDALRMQVEHGGPDDGGWFVTLAADGRVVGDCGTFGPPAEDGRVEIGYGLAAPFRGQGIGTQAVAALVEHLVGEPDVRVVTASVEVGNEPSRRLLERLGFSLTDGPAGTDRHWHFELGVGAQGFVDGGED